MALTVSFSLIKLFINDTNPILLFWDLKYIVDPLANGLLGDNFLVYSALGYERILRIKSTILMTTAFNSSKLYLVK